VPVPVLVLVLVLVPALALKGRRLQQGCRRRHKPPATRMRARRS